MAASPHASPLVGAAEQIGIVVEDLDAAMRSYVELAGIGPWAVYTFAPPRLRNMRIRGVETSYSMRLAIAWTGSMMWELIQPLDGPSIYREFLDRHGEGIHHILVRSEGRDYATVLSELRAKGIEPLMEGHFEGADFAYVASEGALKTVLEFVDRSGRTGGGAQPERWYPAPPAAV